MYTYVRNYMYVYIYIYIEREREKARDEVDTTQFATEEDELLDKLQGMDVDGA